MVKYRMLSGVEQSRVDRVGGKAAILEEIINRWPKANIPRFEIGDNPRTYHGGTIFRASSPLDLFGCFGLHQSFTDVTYRNSSSVADLIRNPDFQKRSRLNLFAQSVGQEWKPPTIISQEQRRPLYWGIIMQHPNNPDIFLVAYSDSFSAESEEAPLSAKSLVERPPQYRRYYMSYARKTYTASVDISLNIEGNLNDDMDKNFLELGVINYITINDLGIVDADWVSILEIGIYSDSTETFQFTPIRRKDNRSNKIPKDKLIFGTCEELELPVIRIPDYIEVENYKDGTSNLDDFPDFKAHADPMIRKYGNSLPGVDVLFWTYIKRVEKKFPDGYLVYASFDPKQQFDITMMNARAVLLWTSSDPLESLNHNVSRLVHKSPVLVIGADSIDIPTGELARFSCNGSSYSIR